MTLNSSYSIILNSNTPTQSNADRLPLLELSNIVQQTKWKKRCSSSDPRLALVKPQKPYGKNEKGASSLMENINMETSDFQAKNLEHAFLLYIP